MNVVMVVAGIGCLLAGLLTIGFGIPVKEFSFGNTLILTGAIEACTGLIILGLWVVVRELRDIAQRLGPAEAGDALTPAAASSTRQQAVDGGGFLFSRDQPVAASSGSAPAPWQDEAAARGARNEALPAPAETAAVAKPRRNLMFSSTSRKEREREQAQARAADPSAADPTVTPAAPPPAADISEASPATFDDAWPRTDRLRSSEVPPQRRSVRAPSTFSETAAGTAGGDRPAPAVRTEDPPVTVLKSGVVDGMAYSLYSDGSIEAQMPEGMMRFASIDELRSHLDQRP